MRYVCLYECVNLRVVFVRSTEESKEVVRLKFSTFSKAQSRIFSFEPHAVHAFHLQYIASLFFFVVVGGGGDV